MKEVEPATPADRLGKLLLVVGGGLLAFAVLADPLTGGSPGFGIRQWALAAVGGILVLEGLRRTPAARGRVRAVLSVRQGELVLTAFEIALLALAFAAAAAVLEGVVLAVSAVFFDAMLRLGPHVVWMSAVTNALLLLAIGLLLLALGAVWRKARSLPVVVFVFALLAADAIVHRFPEPGRAQAWSKWLLAAGVAVFVVRGMTRLVKASRGRIRTVAAAAVALVLLLAVGAFARDPVGERMAMAGAPSAESGVPNVLFIILDTVRAASLSLYGYERPTTPELERLAASGVAFDRAIAPGPWTLPSHATLFTGRYPNELSADWRARLDDTHPTLAEVFAARGYVTAGFSANGAYVNRLTGLERGFARFDDYPESAGEAVRTSVMVRRMIHRLRAADLLQDGYAGRRSAADIGGAFLSWLSNKPEDRPFFAFLNYFDAHDPYMAPAPFDTLFGPVVPMPRLAWGRPPSEELVTAWTDSYDRSIAYLDHELGRLFDELERRGVLDNTIVVVTSDHGEHLGEHDYMRHGNTLYMPVLHVPLIVRFPAAAPAGIRVAPPVTLRDVPATILDLAAIEGTGIPGQSLAQVWRGALPSSLIYAEVREAVRIPARYPNADADLHSVLEHGMQYIRVTDGGEELYHVLEDPDQRNDLAGDSAAAADVKTLRAVLEQHLGPESLARGDRTAAARR